jgi:hypothetical protein
MNLSERIDAFVKRPFAEQKAHAEKLGLVRNGDEKRTNMAEICLWTIRAETLELTDDLFPEN